MWGLLYSAGSSRLCSRCRFLSFAEQLSSTPGRTPRLQHMPTVRIVALQGQDCMYLLNMVIPSRCHPFDICNSFRQRKTFGPRVVVVRDIYNPENVPVSFHFGSNQRRQIRTKIYKFPGQL